MLEFNKSDSSPPDASWRLLSDPQLCLTRPEVPGADDGKPTPVPLDL